MNLNYVSIVCFCLVFNVKYVCNEKKNAKIMNGLNAFPEQFPYMVSLQIQSTGQHICGGAIINSNHVLTAAHCMYLIQERSLLPASILQVYAGSINLTNHGKIARISKIFVHENYELRILDNDIAILRLAGKGFEFSSNIQPVNLSSEFVSNKTLNNRPCTIVGWGRQCGSLIKKNSLRKSDATKKNMESNDYMLPAEYFTKPLRSEKETDDKNRENSNRTLNPASLVETFITNRTEKKCIEHQIYMLRYAEIPIQNSTECAKDYANANITDNLICAGIRGSRIDSCKGDSGGPLVCNGKVEGIVSFGDGCDNFNHLGVYTRVFHHLDWINKTIYSCGCNLKNMFAIYVPLIHVSMLIFNFK